MEDSLIINTLYPLTEKALSKNYKEFQNNLDLYVKKYVKCYMTTGPGERPIFNDDDITRLVKVCGLDEASIKKVLHNTSVFNPNWKIANKPASIADTLATRLFTLKKNDSLLKTSLQYMFVAMYPSLHFKYYNRGINQDLMNYTVNNISKKFTLKQEGLLWDALYSIVKSSYDYYKEKLIEGKDKGIIDYIEGTYTRLNSFMKTISNEYYNNFNEKKYLKVEHESYEEGEFYEADNNTLAIDRLKMNVVNYLVINGPNMELVQLAANISQVSVTRLRACLSTILSEKYRNDIDALVNAILSSYLITNKEQHSFSEIKSNNFLMYCLQLYKKSNTTDNNINQIKNILNRWLNDIEADFPSPNTENSFKRALFTFFVFTIQRLV